MSWLCKKETKETKQLKQIIRWFEIPANDFKRATNFYTNVFGIELNLVELNGIRHGIFKLNEGQITGAIVDAGGSEVKSGVVLFFEGDPTISDLERKIVANGGQILVSKTLIKNKVEEGQYIIPKNFIDGSNLGYFAYFLDTEGNKMGLFGGS